MGRRPKNEYAALADVARKHIKRAEKLGKSLDLRLKSKAKASDEFTLDEDFRRDFAAVTTAIQHAGRSLVTALEANKSDLGGLSEEQLEAQFQAEAVKTATTISDEVWYSMCDAREKAGLPV